MNFGLPGEFESLVAAAKLYARQCGDLDEFAESCKREMIDSGEPAFFLSTIKDPNDPKRFPIALAIHSYDQEKSLDKVIASMDITRPDYKDNSDGFRGNHLVVALLELAREAICQKAPETVRVLTSASQWIALVHSDGFKEEKARRALSYTLDNSPHEAQPVPQKRHRL